MNFLFTLVVEVYFQAFSATTLNSDLQLTSTFGQLPHTQKKFWWAPNTTYDQRARMDALEKRKVCCTITRMDQVRPDRRL